MEGRIIMRDDAVKGVIDEADELRAFELAIRGGEAMLHPHFYELWDYATQKEFTSANLITNGMRLNEERVLSMLDNPRSKIIVSLDGPEDINAKYRNPIQYRKVMNWLLPSLLKKGNQLVVLSTLYKNNLTYIPEFAAYLAGCGLRHYHVTPFKLLGTNAYSKVGFVGPDDLSDLEEKLNDITITTPRFLPFISCPLSMKKTKMPSAMPITIFSEYYRGAGMRITADGSVGISQMVHFSDEFRKKIPSFASIPSVNLGSIDGQRSLQEIWSENFALRLAQSKLARQLYPYVLGFPD